jgi:hypothetical protein
LSGRNTRGPEGEMKKQIKKIRKNWSNDKHANKRFRIHATCISVGMLAAVGTSFMGSFFLHIAPVLPVIPSLIQESIDRLLSL